LSKDPADRPSAKEALEHQFILDHDCPDARAGATIDTIDQGAADALMSFAKASQFRRACMSVMAWSLSNEERAQVRNAFLALDKNKTGTISMCELKEVLTTKFAVTDDQVKPIFDALDTSANEEIHYTEFLAAMVSTRIAMHDDLLAQTFQRFDTDNSGFITVDNLKQVLGESFSGQECEKLVQEADVTKDGKISYQEFIEFVKGGEGNEEKLEVADRIIEHELHKTQPATFGSLAWAKNHAVGLVSRTGASSLLLSGKPSQQSSPDNTASAAPQTPGASKQASMDGISSMQVQSGEPPPKNATGSANNMPEAVAEEKQPLNPDGNPQQQNKGKCCVLQ
jgi:calcium-dependent protein kinase